MGSLPIPPESVEIETAVRAIRVWSRGLLATSLGSSSREGHTHTRPDVRARRIYPLAFCGLLATSLGPSSKYDAVNGGVNNPLAFFVIPYDSYRALQSDQYPVEIPRGIRRIRFFFHEVLDSSNTSWKI
jgi:hypothetical protein